MKVLRATYTDTELEGIADRAIGVERNAESHIITLNPDMPFELQGVIWQTVGDNIETVYMPIYNVIKDIPVSYTMGNSNYSTNSAYWAFRGFAALGNFKQQDFKHLIRNLWGGYEQQFINEHSYLNKTLKDMYKKNPQSAIDFAAKYSTGILYQMVGVANKERNSIMTKITKFNE